MSAPTAFQRLGVAAAALASAGLIAFAVASYLISAEAARDAVMAEVKAASGFEPSVTGPASLSIFPAPRIAISGVALSNPADAEAPFTTERLVAYLRWLPLLAGRFEIADLSLERPNIAVRVDADGRSNWSPLIDRLARAVRAGASASPPSMSFSEIRVADGVIAVEDRARGTAETLSRVDLSLAWPSIAKTFAATGRVTWRDEPLDVGLTIGDFPAALAGENSGLKLRIAGAPVKLAFDGGMSYLPNVKIDGTLAADASSLRNTLGWISGKPLPGSGFGRFALKARTNVVGGTIALSNLNVELDGNVAEGVLSYATRGRRTLQGTLAVDSLDLTPYASAARLLAADARTWSRKPIALDWFEAMDFDLRVSAARMIAAQTRLGRTAVAATLGNGRLVITVGESQGFNGVINGSLALAKMPGGAHLRSQLQLANVDLETCLADLFGIRRLEGKGTLSLAIEGRGGSVMALTRTLNGAASLSASKGALTGLNVEQLLRRLERRPLAASADFRTGRTPFESLRVALGISQGTARLEEVHFAGANVRLALSGTASIPSRDLDLNGTASLLGAAEAASGFELPFFVQGSWDDPIMLPDPQALLRRSGAAAPLLDAVTDQRNAVRSIIERLVGGAPLPDLRRNAPMPIPFEPAPQGEIPTEQIPSR